MRVGRSCRQDDLIATRIRAPTIFSGLASLLYSGDIRCYDVCSMLVGSLSELLRLFFLFTVNLQELSSRTEVMLKELYSSTHFLLCSEP